MILATFTDTAIADRQIFDYTTGTLVTTHTKLHSVREIGVFFTSQYPVYVLGHGAQFSSLSLDFDQHLMHTAVLPDITTIGNLVQIPNSFFLVASAEGSKIVIAPFLALPVNIPAQVLELGFEDVVQIEFFKTKKLMILSTGEPDMVRVYALDQYLCEQPLRDCGDDPSAGGSCVANAVEDEGVCRCTSGFFNSFSGECLACHASCTECVGMAETDCVDTTHQDSGGNPTQIYNDPTSAAETDNWKINSLCMNEYLEEEFLMLASQDKVTVFKSEIENETFPSFYLSLSLPIATAPPAGISRRRGWCEYTGA
jgi:hypothetical protein